MFKVLKQAKLWINGLENKMLAIVFVINYIIACWFDKPIHPKDVSKNASNKF